MEELNPEVEKRMNELDYRIEDAIHDVINKLGAGWCYPSDVIDIDISVMQINYGIYRIIVKSGDAQGFGQGRNPTIALKGAIANMVFEDASS